VSSLSFALLHINTVDPEEGSNLQMSMSTDNKPQEKPALSSQGPMERLA
jgi:hypothetical protein